MNEEEFFNKYVMRNPFDFKKSIIAHCRTLDKYDVYQWVADDEEEIKNLLEENNQLKEKINKALHRIQLLQMDGEVSIRDLGKIANILIDKEVE